MLVVRIKSGEMKINNIEPRRGSMLMNREQEVQMCDARDDDQGTEAGNIRKLFL
jgi:hypothetical protein